MKKTILLTLVLVLVAAGLYVQHQKAQVIPSTPPKDEASTPVVPGTYAIWQTTRATAAGQETKFFRLRPFSNELPTAFAMIDADETWTRGVMGEVSGSSILVRRYVADADAYFNLSGTLLTTLSKDEPARLVAADDKLKVEWRKTYTNRAATVSLHTADKQGQTTDIELDPAQLGITLGYAEPFLISDDGASVYLRQIFEGEGCGISGLWRYDVASGKVQKLSVVSDLNLQDYHINPTTQQLIGVGYKLVDDPEATGPSCGKPDGVRSIYLVDLKTDGQQILTQDGALVYYHVMLSDDGTQYAYQLSGNEDVWMGPVDGSQVAKDLVPGYALDWFGNTLVVDYGSVLSLYDLASGTQQKLGTDTGPDDQVDYVGHVTLKVSVK